ncbi:pep-2 [Matsumuraeses phaseoli granulovirus]|uniref:Pep-2 n=1 Tax=Matsumuraeses phaseoli granulovirus TaxID=2760664 RepID=A0AAE7SY81_9BBAC|nr:pep-2 [Matsumuraeses phaseoli granulovirus]QOD39986.1 pep-2 [Matsumuraeses phaseoli granulovirus]
MSNSNELSCPFRNSAQAADATLPSSSVCVFVKPFDGINVQFIFVDMVLWVGADEALRILKLPTQALFSLPDSEKAPLKKLDTCSDSNKWFVTALGVGLLTTRLVNRGSLNNDNLISNDHQLSERANAFANIFLTDVVTEIRTSRLLCNISKEEDDILTLLNEPINNV